MKAAPHTGAAFVVLSPDRVAHSRLRGVEGVRMTFLLVVLVGWSVLSVVCFAMGSGLMRPRHEQPEFDGELRQALKIPAPRASVDGTRVPAGV